MKYNTVKYILVSVCLLAGTGTGVFASPDDFYDDFLKEALEEYNGFRDSLNKEYSEFLSQPWTPGKIRPAIKKKEEQPLPIRKDGERNREYEDWEYDFDGVEPVVDPEPQPQPVEPIPDVVIDHPLVTSVSFYGTPLDFSLDPKLRLSWSVADEQGVGTAWDYFSRSAGSTKLLSELLSYRESVGLSDWAYYQMVEKLAEKLFRDAGMKRFFTGWAMAQSGYAVRLAFTESGDLMTLIGSDDLIYGFSGLRLDGKNYYYFHEGPASGMLRFTEKDFPGSRPFSVRKETLPKLAFESAGRKTLTVKHYPEIKVEMEANKNLLDYYASVPRSSMPDNEFTQWNQYADTPLSEHNKKMIYPILRKAIEGKTEHEAADIIIDFCESFDYKLDDEMWGHDRAFYPDETLHYFYSDCEDHAILFTRLIRDLLGLQTGLIYYQGHLAALVVFNESVPGDYYEYQGKKWMVCDPTYFYVGVGKQAPNVDTSKAVLIPLPKR